VAYTWRGDNRRIISAWDEDFWKNARVVMPDEQGKSLVSLRVDRAVLAR